MAEKSATKKVKVFLRRGYWPLDEERIDLEKKGVNREHNGGKLNPGDEPEGGVVMDIENAKRLFHANVIKVDDPFEGAFTDEE